MIQTIIIQFDSGLNVDSYYCLQFITALIVEPIVVPEPVVTEEVIVEKVAEPCETPVVSGMLYSNI